MGENIEVNAGDSGRRLRPVKSLVRAIDLLDVLAREGEPLGVTELASATGFSKTAAYNLITTLESRGLIRRDGGNRYDLGWRLFELGEMVRSRSALGELARPHVINLAEKAGETAMLAILDSDTVFCLEMAESRRSLPIAFAPGQRASLDENAAGEVLLAFASAGRRRRYLQGVAGDSAREDRIAHFERIRSDGFAISSMHAEAAVASIAVPVHDYTKEVVAALTLAGPTTRFTTKRRRSLLIELRREAAEVSRALGFR